MADKVSTSTLMKRLFKTKHIDTFLRQNEKNMHTVSFSEHLKSLCSERGLVQERVILQSGIDRTYGHQLFSGLRRPSRDKVLQLAFGFGLDVDETQKLLRLAGKSQLYPRLKREAIIIYCLQQKYSVMDTQEMLSNYGMTLLGGAPINDE